MENKGYIVNLPLRVKMPSKVTPYFSLNLNIYRNAHYLPLNKAKFLFSKEILPLLKDIPPCNQVKLVYTMFPATRRKIDVANVCSIVDKFFSDTLVQAGVIPDDSYLFLPEVTYCFGSVDSKNPRVEVHIIPTQ